jgi:hypothetical protein
MLSPVFGTIAARLLIEPSLWAEAIGLVIGAWTLVMIFAAVGNGWAYFSQVGRDNFSERQRALALTPQVLLSENMKQMHPSAVAVLAMYGRTTWSVIPGRETSDQTIYILYGTQVTYAFAADFLFVSNRVSCAPEWKFSNEGAKKYAPEGLEAGWCTDREQYQQLIAYLFGRMMVTRAHGNQAAAWIPPWNPETVAKLMNIELAELPSA